MFSVCICGETINEQTASILKEKKASLEIIAFGTVLELCDKHIDHIPNNEAIMRNLLVKEASGEYILWLHPQTQIEEEFFDDIVETLEEREYPDLIYCNEIIQDKNGTEKVFNKNQWYDNEKALLHNLILHQEIPKWGVVQKRVTCMQHQFDSKYGPAAFWKFLYDNISHLKLTLAELAFVTNPHEERIDRSYESLMLRDILKKYDFQKDIFVHLNWNRENIAYSTAFTTIGEKLVQLHDYYNASLFFNQALTAFHNQTSCEKLVDAYIQMGLFEEAKKVIQTQLSQNRQKEFLELLESIQKLITKLEELIQNGKYEYVIKASKAIRDTYDGALIHNILAAAYIYMDDKTDAFAHLLLAAMMNPLDRTILENLAPLAKMLHKEEEVIGLYQRLTQKE